MDTPEIPRSVISRTILVLFGAGGACVVCLVIALVLYVLEVSREKRQLAPPAGVNGLAAFSKAVSPPKRLVEVEHDGSEYIVWYGELAGPLDLPSGRSCYLFDANGTLIDWQPETGEGGRIDRFLESSSKGREITIDAALKKVAPISASDGPVPGDVRP